MVKVTKDLENKTLILERVFNAPKQKLWQAFSDKDMFVKWWGPEGWDTTVKEFDFRPDGRNHYCMKCVDEAQGEWFGQESWGIMQYTSIDEPNSFAYKDYFSDAEGTLNTEMPVTESVIELKELDGKTVFVSRTVVETAEDLEKLVRMGMIEGFDSSMDKLDELLAA